MRKSIPTILAVAALGLGGCATGYGGMGGPLESVLGSVLGGQGQGQGQANGFQQAAIQACGNHASQYGRVTVQDVRQQSRDTLRVYGAVGTNYGARNFACNFRSDGRITAFDI